MRGSPGAQCGVSLHRGLKEGGCSGYCSPEVCHQFMTVSHAAVFAKHLSVGHVNPAFLLAAQCFFKCVCVCMRMCECRGEKRLVTFGQGCVLKCSEKLYKDRKRPLHCSYLFTFVVIRLIHFFALLVTP